MGLSADGMDGGDTAEAEGQNRELQPKREGGWRKGSFEKADFFAVWKFKGNARLDDLPWSQSAWTACQSPEGSSPR